MTWPILFIVVVVVCLAWHQDWYATTQKAVIRFKEQVVYAVVVWKWTPSERWRTRLDINLAAAIRGAAVEVIMEEAGPTSLLNQVAVIPSWPTEKFVMTSLIQG